jgi:hypothetical protein
MFHRPLMSQSPMQSRTTRIPRNSHTPPVGSVTSPPTLLKKKPVSLVRKRLPQSTVLQLLPLPNPRRKKMRLICSARTMKLTRKPRNSNRSVWLPMLPRSLPNPPSLQNPRSCWTSNRGTMKRIWLLWRLVFAPFRLKV